MKYAILGAGGIGGSLGAYLAAAGKDVILLARGKHYEALKAGGLMLHSVVKGELHLPDIKVSTVEEYKDIPDVLFVTVKGYSLKALLPFLKQFAGQDTMVIPLLNIYGTGDYLKEAVPGLNVISGCIYIVAHISAPGEITQEAKIFRVVIGTDGEDEREAKLKKISDDLQEAGIKVVLSKHISADAFRKFSFISPYAATGAYYDYTAGQIEEDEEALATFRNLVLECKALGEAMGLQLPEDLPEQNMRTLAVMGKDATASMQKDLARGKDSELEGLVLQLVDWGKKYHVAMPVYEKVSQKLGKLLKA